MKINGSDKKAPTDFTQLAPRFLEPRREGWSRLGSARKTQLCHCVVQPLTGQRTGPFKTNFRMMPPDAHSVWAPRQEQLFALCFNSRYLSAVSALESKDKFILESVSGWLMLGNAAEALHELDQLSAEAKERPEALIVQWDIYAHVCRWTEAVDLADRLLKMIPDEPAGYIKRAYALHELKRTREAWETLAPVQDRFDTNWLIPYNLACYACQLGRSSEAVELIKQALVLGDRCELCDMALKDIDLEPIRADIEKLTDA